MRIYISTRIFIYLFMLFPSIIPAPPGEYHSDNLLEAICTYESRDFKDPNDAVAKADEIGRCQPRRSTVKELLNWQGSNADLDNLVLRDYWRNTMVAKMYLDKCRDKHGWHWKQRKKVAYCYNAGLYAKPFRDRGAWKYATEVISVYDSHRMKGYK